MHELYVKCEKCGQELLVDGSDDDGNPMSAEEYVGREHRHGHMVVCDACRADLGYNE